MTTDNQNNDTAEQSLGESALNDLLCTDLFHYGRFVNRLENNPLEAAFARLWAYENSRKCYSQATLEALLGDGEVTQRDATVAATIIQWLGSPVGQYFIKRAVGA